MRVDAGWVIILILFLAVGVASTNGRTAGRDIIRITDHGEDGTVVSDFLESLTTKYNVTDGPGLLQ